MADFKVRELDDDIDFSNLPDWDVVILGVRLKDNGSIAVDSYYETSRHGIFAVGDVHGDIKLITVAWAEGIQAAICAFNEITSPYWLNERRLRDQRITLIGEKISEAAASRAKKS